MTAPIRVELRYNHRLVLSGNSDDNLVTRPASIEEADDWDYDAYEDAGFVPRVGDIVYCRAGFLRCERVTVMLPQYGAMTPRCVADVDLLAVEEVQSQ